MHSQVDSSCLFPEMRVRMYHLNQSCFNVRMRSCLGAQNNDNIIRIYKYYLGPISILIATYLCQVYAIPVLIGSCSIRWNSGMAKWKKYHSIFPVYNLKNYVLCFSMRVFWLEHLPTGENTSHPCYKLTKWTQGMSTTNNKGYLRLVSYQISGGHT